MTHNKLLDRDPSVMITSNQNELKIYQDNIVYLNNGDNFELRFFNPLQEKIGVDINFNGMKKGDGYLILNPGQDISLDRFLDEQRKMIFETYSINGDSKEAREAIEKNGKISFNFYKESNWRNNYSTGIDVNYNFPPKPEKYEWSGNQTFTTFSSHNSNSRTYSGQMGAKGVSGNSGSVGTSTTRGVNYSGDVVFTNTSTFSSPGIFTSEVDESYIPFQQDYVFASSAGEATIDSLDMSPMETNPIETGRVEKGKHSNQSFKEVSVDFQSTAFYTVDYQLMPHSAKNRNVSEVRQYCSCCGYRIRKQTWKFCPKCGGELQ